MGLARNRLIDVCNEHSVGKCSDLDDSTSSDLKDGQIELPGNLPLSFIYRLWKIILVMNTGTIYLQFLPPCCA